MTGRILIAEATAEQRILLRAKLASAFYTVTTAESGAEALRLAAATPPDLVIAGSMLPDMCGTTFCTHLRALGGHRDTPLVLRSDEDRPEERLALLAVGADDVIARSDGEVLLARLRNLLSHARTRDEMRMRDDTQRALGLAEAPQGFSRPPKITLLPLTPDPALDATAAQLRIALDAQLRTAEPRGSWRRAHPRQRRSFSSTPGAALAAGSRSCLSCACSGAGTRLALSMSPAPASRRSRPRRSTSGPTMCSRVGSIRWNWPCVCRV